MCDYTLLTKVFTKGTLLNLINNKYNPVLNEAIVKYIDDYQNITYLESYNILYEIMGKKYRNEYFYKNTALNKWLFGKFSTNTTTVLTEFPISNSKGDFLVINKVPTVYEIKTELDNLDRLEGQLSDYYKAFANVGIITCEKNEEIIANKFGDSPVGIYILTKKNTLKKIKDAEESKNELNSDTIFSTLRKSEYESLIKSYFGVLPNANSFEYYDSCRQQFNKMDINILYNNYCKVLKERKKVDKRLNDVPKSLKLLCYNLDLQESQLNKLEKYLNQKYKEV